MLGYSSDKIVKTQKIQEFPYFKGIGIKTVTCLLQYNVTKISQKCVLSGHYE